MPADRAKIIYLAVAAGLSETAVVAIAWRDLAPWSILGLLGGAVAVTRAPRPSALYVAAALLRSGFVGIVASQLALGLGANPPLAVAAAGLGSYLSEELLTGLAVLGGRFAKRPLATWRAARGMLTPEESGNHVRPVDPRGDEQ